MLMDKLYAAGVRGKVCRLICKWFDGGSCCVKVDGRNSESFSVKIGVEQGSVLSPILSLLVMDPLLRKLEASELGLSLHNYIPCWRLCPIVQF